MKQATNIKDFIPSLALPGIKINTGPNDYRVNKQMQMMKFNGERWELFGPIIEDAGPAGWVRRSSRLDDIPAQPPRCAGPLSD